MDGRLDRWMDNWIDGWMAIEKYIDTNKQTEGQSDNYS